ncbi:hypothetical protein [Oryza sativa Japonica Group]|uniref:Uncharacterized protein n=6 Tax=Oryza TaxID=4527 RepID=Q5NA26_ORYSJ|nr:hypothetical protein [Oryza sativa Japonica Group]
MASSETHLGRSGRDNADPHALHASSMTNQIMRSSGISIMEYISIRSTGSAWDNTAALTYRTQNTNAFTPINRESTNSTATTTSLLRGDTVRDRISHASSSTTGGQQRRSQFDPYGVDADFDRYPEASSYTSSLG